MRAFVLTGAGVSAESGLGTFRDPGGLWERHDPRRLATPEAFAADPALVHRFYDWRRRTALAAAPNAAHAALARLERGLAARGGALHLCTQNVDDLHERGGSAQVHHMHGSLFGARCLACGAVSDWRGDMGVEARCPACGAARLRPDIVWFGEMPRGLDAIAAELRAADLFVAVGTSGAVYPAAGFVAEARGRGIPTLEINRDAADNAGLFDDAIYGPATEAVPAWVDGVLGEGRVTGPIIAEATRADLPEVAALVNAAYRGDAARRGWTHESDLLAGQRTDAATLRDELDAPDPSAILVLRETPGAPPAACVMVQRFRDEDERLVCHLAMLTVDPDRQGRGLGAALIGEVERRARAEGCAAVEMTVIHARAELLAFYGRRGYAPTGRTKPFPYGDERFGRPLRDDLHFVVIEKALAP